MVLFDANTFVLLVTKVNSKFQTLLACSCVACVVRVYVCVRVRVCVSPNYVVGSPDVDVSLMTMFVPHPANKRIQHNIVCISRVSAHL